MVFPSRSMLTTRFIASTIIIICSRRSALDAKRVICLILINRFESNRVIFQASHRCKIPTPTRKKQFAWCRWIRTSTSTVTCANRATCSSPTSLTRDAIRLTATCCAAIATCNKSIHIIACWNRLRSAISFWAKLFFDMK